jgi:hypothetical protein
VRFVHPFDEPLDDLRVLGGEVLGFGLLERGNGPGVFDSND